MTQVAGADGPGCESPDKALAPDAKPRLNTVLKVARIFWRSVDSVAGVAFEYG